MKKMLTIIFASLLLLSGCNQRSVTNEIESKDSEYQENNELDQVAKKTGSISIISPSVNFGQKITLDKNYYPEKYDIKTKCGGDINYFAFKIKDSKGIRWEEEKQVLDENCEISLPIDKFDFDDFDSEIELIFQGYYMNQNDKKELLFENKLIGVTKNEANRQSEKVNTNIFQNDEIKIEFVDGYSKMELRNDEFVIFFGPLKDCQDNFGDINKQEKCRPYSFNIAPFKNKDDVLNEVKNWAVWGPEVESIKNFTVVNYEGGGAGCGDRTSQIIGKMSNYTLSTQVCDEDFSTNRESDYQYFEKVIKKIELLQEVNDLKSYTSDNFGIKFSFPVGWLAREIDDNILIKKFVNNEHEELEIYFAKFRYIDNLNNIGGTINNKPISVDITTLDMVNINGNFWYKGNCLERSCMGNEEFYITKRNNKYLAVEIMSGFIDDFEKMVNSIEFIKN